MSRGSEIISAKSFNVGAISLSAQSTMKSGAKSAFINYNKGGFFIQTPSLSVPMGLSCFTDEKTGKKQYSLQLSLRDYDADGKVKEFYEMMNSIDTYMIEQGVKNSKDWFGKQCSMELIQDKYSTCTKASKTTDKSGNPYPPSFRLKLKTDDNTGEFLFKNVINKKKETVDVSFEEAFGRNCKVTCLLKASMVWFTNAGYGITWRPEQIRIDEESSTMSLAPAMVDEDEESSAPVRKTNIINDDEVFATKPSAVTAVLPSDSEDEDDDDEEDTIPAIPIPKKTTTVLPMKKKVISKK